MKKGCSILVISKNRWYYFKSCIFHLGILFVKVIKVTKKNVFLTIITDCSDKDVVKNVCKPSRNVKIL